MDDELSPSALRAISHAKRFASGRSAEAAELIDLLAGLLAEDESHASLLLRSHIPQVDRLLAELSVPQSAAAHVADELPLSQRVAAVVSRARQLAVAYSRLEPACSEELLVGLLTEGPEAANVFERHGVDGSALLRDYHARKRPDLIAVDAEDVVNTQGDVAERMDIARILDANANRAREALRILEDYARFSLDDGELSRRLKVCRHSLAEAMALLPESWLLMARNTEGDVGTTISTRGEGERADLGAVVTANAKRAQEAVRTLEEYAKIESGDAARILERIRYDLYSIEQLLWIARSTRARLADAGLYWLVDPDACAATLDWMVQRAIEGGVRIIQLRAKRLSDRELIATARQLRHWTKELGALFVVNDRPDIARLCNADGVHVGQDDLSVKDTRKIVGPNILVGVSTHSIEQARQAVREGADYLGVGPVFPSATKSFEGFPGTQFVRQAAAEITLPFFCIGGIHDENIEEILRVGGTRIAVSHAISTHHDPFLAARGLSERLAQSVTSAS